MQKRRLELHSTFVAALGSNNVYFQPPPNIQMKYPAIVYELNGINNKLANNQVYIQHPGFKVTVIDKDPDSEIPGKVSRLPYSRFVTSYKSDNLNHTVFALY